MWETLYKKINFGPGVEEISGDDDCRIIKATGKNGDAVFKIYSIFKGVFIMFSDVRMQECDSLFSYDSNLLCIDHCKEGKIHRMAGSEYLKILKSGELRIYTRKNLTEKIFFPLGIYKGLTFIFEMDEISRELTDILDGFSSRVRGLKDKYCDSNFYYIVESTQSIEHVFTELYSVSSKIQDEYFKIKVIEILLFLEALELNDSQDEKQYFSRGQVEKIKLMHEFLTQNLSKNYTIDELSGIFNISPTPLKKCFKHVYGEPVYKYMKSYRMNYAASILRKNADMKVIDIAGVVGYDSPSKFAAAFKKEMGKSPLEYRKSFISIKK